MTPSRCSEIPISKVLTKRIPKMDNFKMKANAGEFHYVQYNHVSINHSGAPSNQFRGIAPAAILSSGSAVTSRRNWSFRPALCQERARCNHRKRALPRAA